MKWRDTGGTGAAVEAQELKTTDANEQQTGQAGKTNLEDYDVERAIGIVQELGEGLIEATKHSKHHFRKEWLEQLVERYRIQPGKPIIHLDDLYDDVVPSLSPESGVLLLPYWKSVVQWFGYNEAMSRFRCQRDIVATGGASRWSKLRNWRQFSELTGLRVNDLEPYVVALRASGAGKTRVILKPKLPFNLATPAGAKIIGYRGDAAYKTSAFHNLDEFLHEDYKHAITETIGGNPFTTTFREDGVNRTNVGVFVTQLASLAGIDNTQRQKMARNPFPGWFFQSPDEIIISGLRALCDAEGSPDDGAVRISQAAGFDNLDVGGLCVPWPAKKSVNLLSEPTMQTILQKPPLILASASLLLHHLGIMSYVMPERFSRAKHSDSVYWNLSIYRGKDMRKFGDTIGFASPAKKQELKDILH